MYFKNHLIKIGGIMQLTMGLICMPNLITVLDFRNRVGVLGLPGITQQYPAVVFFYLNIIGLLACSDLKITPNPT
jgi:hypothetical protein